MNGGIVPLLLLSAAIGLALSFTSWRAAWISVVAFVVTTLLASVSPFPQTFAGVAIGGLLVSTLLTSALVYLPKGLPEWLAGAAAINGGVWLGFLASVSLRRSDLAFALPLSLLFIPGRWLCSRGYSIAIKVVCSWLIAIAALAIFVSLVPTPGYKPDHMK